MTLAALLAAMPTDLSGLALVFDQQLRDRLVSVQSEYGDPRFTAYPAALSDGRYMHLAGILRECQPGGLYHAGFSQLDAARFDEIEVVPLADAVALLPAE
jgi:hypothetical protein